jgi:hypothetical protein
MIWQRRLPLTARQTSMLPNESEITAKSLSKLWPHRMHESNYLKNLCCHLGLHRWSRLDLSALAVKKDVIFCRWCSKLKIDGVMYGD